VCPSSHIVRRSCAATLILVSLANASCQVWHREHIAPESLVTTRQPTQLRVTRTDGSQTILEHPVMRADTLSGTALGESNAPEVRIPLADVGQVATRRFSAGRTIALGVGLAAAAVAAIVAVFLINCPGTSACSN
jgi:hypothetical protein